MSSAANRFGPGQQTQEKEIQAVKDHLHQQPGIDPPAGAPPAITNQAVREAQREQRVTGVSTTQSRPEQPGVSTGRPHPDIPKGDPAGRVGPPTPEKVDDASRQAAGNIGREDQARLAEIKESLQGRGVSPPEPVSTEKGTTARPVIGKDADNLKEAAAGLRRHDVQHVPAAAEGGRSAAVDRFAAAPPQKETVEPSKEPPPPER